MASEKLQPLRLYYHQVLLHPAVLGCHAHGFLWRAAGFAGVTVNLTRARVGLAALVCCYNTERLQVIQLLTARSLSLFLSPSHRFPP